MNEGHELSKDGRVLGLEITEICNFSCVHCYLERKIRPKFDLTLAKAISNVAADSGFLFVYITGGEPMLHPQFLDIYKAFRTKGYFVSVYTNASYIKEETFELFTNLPPSVIEITLYGMSEETYRDMAQVKNKYDKVINNIRRLRSLGLRLLLKYNIVTVTRDDFRAFLDFAKEMECEVSVNTQILPMLNGDLGPTKYRLQPSEITQIGQEFGFDFSPSGDGYDGCDAGKSLFIDSQGRVRGCPVLHTDFDQTVSQNPGETIKNMENLFREFQRQRTQPFCPAWIKLEGVEEVTNLLNGLKELPLA